MAHIAKKYQNSGVDADDLVSIGSIGLMKAVNTFRADAGKLTTYASRCIENEILMYLRSNRKNRNTVLLEEPIGADKEGNEICLIDLLGTDPDEVPGQAEISIESDRALLLIRKALDAPREAGHSPALRPVGWNLHPQHEVAARLGISRSYVSRIEKKALEKLEQALCLPRGDR